MDGQGIVETVSLAIACAIVATVTFDVVAGVIDWAVVLIVAVVVGIGKALSYSIKADSDDSVGAESRDVGVVERSD